MRWSEAVPSARCADASATFKLLVFNKEHVIRRSPTMDEKSPRTFRHIIQAVLIGFVLAVILNEIFLFTLPFAIGGLIAWIGFPSSIDFEDIRTLSTVAALILGAWFGVKVYKDMQKQKPLPSAASIPIDDPRTDVTSEFLLGGQRVESLFQTEKGVVALLQDGRAVGPVDMKYQLFGSLAEYRRVSGDQAHWPEVTDVAEKRAFFVNARAYLEETKQVL